MSKEPQLRKEELRSIGTKHGVPKRRETCVRGPRAQDVRLPRPGLPSRVLPPLVASVHSSAPPPPSPPRGDPTSRQLERRDTQPSRPARQGHSCCHFLRGGSRVISGKDYPDRSPQLGGGSLFSTNEDGGKRYGAWGARPEGMGPWRRDRKKGGTSESEGRSEGGEEGVALEQVSAALRPFGTAHPWIGLK